MMATSSARKVAAVLLQPPHGRIYVFDLDMEEE
jgi:hypothetical protein